VATAVAVTVAVAVAVTVAVAVATATAVAVAHYGTRSSNTVTLSSTSPFDNIIKELE
jgi:hypothetical protein